MCAPSLSRGRQRKDEKYSEGQTFFIGCRDEPVDLIEGFALAVFRHYTAGVAHGNGAGAEWWPLVMESARADEVGLHFDKDYGREDDGDHRYPFLGTVSYLCGGGAPTLFLERCEGDKSPTIPRGFLSQVTPGKQVAFDGRFLHCAPADLVDAWGMHTMPKKKEPRITLLVNIWLHEKPLDAVRWAPPAVDGAVVVAAPPPPLPALHLVWPAPAPVPTLHVEPGRTLTRVRLKMDALTLQFALDCDIVATSGATCVELVWDAASGLCTLGKVAKKKAATAAKKASAPPKGGKKVPLTASLAPCANPLRRQRQGKQRK